jgi:hypothetical protein
MIEEDNLIGINAREAKKRKPQLPETMQETTGREISRCFDHF